MPESADVAITTVVSILVITCIIGNSLVCVVVKRNLDMRIPINYLLVNLAVSDMMYSTFILPKYILSLISTHPEGVTGKVLCTLLTYANFAWIGADTAIFTMVAISVERYYAVVYPHGNQGKLTTRKLKVNISCFWIFSLILNIPLFLNDEYDKEIDPHACIQAWSDGQKWIPKALFFAKFAFAVVSFVLMAVLYARVVYTLWFQRNDDNELTCRQKVVLKVRKRVTFMVVIVTAMFGIPWLTDLSLEILHVFDELGSNSHVVFAITHTMFMFNSAINPFVYALINQRFREKMKGMLCCWKTAGYYPAEPRSNPVVMSEVASTDSTPK